MMRSAAGLPAPLCMRLPPPARAPSLLRRNSPWALLPGIENGAPYGPGLDDLGLAPERLVTVAAAKSRDVLWAMEEALRCRAVGTVIGEIRSADRLDLSASRR